MVDHQGVRSHCEITFFVPCFNEEGNVVPTIETIVRAMERRAFDYEVLVYDDGSTDASASQVKSFIASHPDLPVALIENKITKGLGSNYVAGAHTARGKHYMMVCGDNDTPIETLNFLLDQKGKADIIAPYLINLHERPFGRRVFSRAFTALVAFLSGTYLHYYNGIVLHLTATIRRFPPASSGFAYQAEILCRAASAGVSCLEVPIRTVPQKAFFTTSAFRFKNILSVGRSLWRICWNRSYHCPRSLRKNSPIAFLKSLFQH